MNNLESSALVIVDLQVDFCPGGSLPVTGGDTIVSGINSLISSETGIFKKIILTADWHPFNHISFASSHNREPYSTMELDDCLVTLWPDHCVEGTRGSCFHSDLKASKADLIIRKGRSSDIDSYSAFFENDRKTPTGLTGYLENHGIDTVFICGLALDWCVYFSAMDSIKQGFETSVILDLTRAVDLPVGYALEKEEEMQTRGINIINSSYFLG